MNRPLALVLLVSAAVTWTLETVNRERLIKRLDGVRQTVRAMGRVQREHEDLLRRQPFLGELESLRRDRAELVGLRREALHREQFGGGSTRAAAMAAIGREVLPTAIWLPVSEMKDLGRSTPHATLQTLFWAAQAGQVHALKDTLMFEPGAREIAEQIATRLPASQPRSPELLVAQALLKHPPAGEIQVVTEQLKGFDQATEYLALRDAAGGTKPVYLQLRWEPGGWRIAVPLQVIENAAREIAGLATSEK
jgi:hypothetical protein